MAKIKYIDEVNITGKKVLLRLDLNVSLNPDFSIADDARIQQSLPSIKYLLQNKNRLILVSHLDRPKKRDPKYSLQVVVDSLKKYLPEYEIILVDDFLSHKNYQLFADQKENQILVLENIRFYHEEKKNSPEFNFKLSSLADIYVNDAFGVSHRADSSVVGVPHTGIPAYGGLLLKKEVQMILKIIQKPKHPVLAIIGGAKISTKINLIGKLVENANNVIVGGGLANTFLAAQGFNIGKSLYEHEQLDNARRMFFMAAQKHTTITLPLDVVVASSENATVGKVKKLYEVIADDIILDIGPETQAKFGAIIAKSKTIVWNGPVGYFENVNFRRGTDFIFYSIAQNQDCITIVGGGDTISAISKKEYLDKITHISTGGGAMLEFIEKGTLPGLEALKR